MHLTRQAWLNNLLLNGLNSLSGSNIVLLGLVIGAMMAIDMGGPFNKAAYVFATALTEGNAAPITANGRRYDSTISNRNSNDIL